MKRVLLTGGSGFLGANLARRLLDDGYAVHLLLRPEHEPWRIQGIERDVERHNTDLGDSDSVAALIKNVRPDWVFNLAAHGAYSSQTNLDDMLRTNVLGTIALVNACRNVGVESFVQAGSSSEYGYKDHPPPESEGLEPNSDYAFTKASASLYCQYCAQHHGFPARTLRLYSAYGPFEEPTRLMPTLIAWARTGQWPPLADRKIARDFVYVDDVSEAFIRAANAPHANAHPVYNVGTGIQSTLEEVVALVGELLNVSEEPEWGTMPARHWDTNVWIADSTRIAEDLGWAPTHTLREGLSTFVDWFEQYPSRADYCRKIGVKEQ